MAPSFVILSAAKDLGFSRTLEILRSLRSLRMTGRIIVAEVSTCFQQCGQAARDSIHGLVDEIQHRALSLQFLPQGRFVFDVLGPDKYPPGALGGAFVAG
jgi:hypothetical protein